MVSSREDLSKFELLDRGVSIINLDNKTNLCKASVFEIHCQHLNPEKLLTNRSLQSTRTNTVSALRYLVKNWHK